MGFLGGGFFGSGASETVSNTTSVSSVQNLDAADNEGIQDITTLSNLGNNASVSIQKTDYGALDTAAEISGQSIAAIERSVAAMSGANESSVAALRQTAVDALDTAQAASELDSAETMKVLIVAAGVVAVAYAWVRFKRG